MLYVLLYQVHINHKGSNKINVKGFFFFLMVTFIKGILNQRDVGLKNQCGKISIYNVKHTIDIPHSY